MSSQLDILRRLYPYDVLFPKVCDLGTKPPASCVPASILRCVAILTLSRRTVSKSSDDGIIRPPRTSSNSTSQTNSTGISSAAIAGVVIGSFAFGIFVMFISYMFWRRRRIMQAKSQAADQDPKVEGASWGGMTYPMPWATQGDDESVTTSSPSPRRQKDRQYQTPPTRYDDSGDAGRSASMEGTAFTSQNPPSYLAATTTNTGTR
jgi:hypothetical protein